MLNDAHRFSRVFIAAGYSDLRKGIDGLANLIKFQFELDPFQKDVLFLFCGTRTDRIKGLVREGLSADFCYPHIHCIYVEK